MDFNLDEFAMNEIMDLFRELERTVTNGLNQVNDSLRINSDLTRKSSNLLHNSERRTVLRSLNSEINDAKQEFEWLPNDDGIWFGHLADGNRDPRVENIPANIDDIRNAEINTIVAIMTHYDLFQPRETLTLEQKRSKIFRFLGLHVY